jgi:hypothetical protein
MTILRSALLVLLAAIPLACNKVDTAEPRAAAPATAPEDPQSGTKTPTPVPATTASATADGQAITPVGTAVLEFQKQVEAYMKRHNEAEAKVPNLKRTDDPVEISKREKELAQMIMTLRAGAQPGEIFNQEVAPHFMQIIKEDFAKRSAVDRRALGHELPKGVKVAINTEYPTTIPLLTFPPALLQKLPDLPPELEYRIVGRHLILRDVKANLIVDALYDVMPIPT